MKFVKKMISSICAVSLLATTAVSIMTAHAEYTKPEVEVALNSYNKDTGIGEAVVKINGVSSALVGDRADWYVAGAVINVSLDSDIFDTSYYTSAVLAKKNVVKDVDYGGNLTPGKYNTTGKYFKVSLAGTMELGDMSIFKFPFTVKDTSKDATISFAEAEVDIMADSTNKAGLLYSKGEVDIKPLTIPGNKPAEPVEPAKPTVKDDGTILPIKPSDIGGTGDVFVGEDGSNAVAGLGNFTSTGTVNGIEWTIKYTPKGEAEVTKSKTFTPEWLAGANLETKMTIGLIVNYNPAEYENVTIVSGSLN